MTETIARLHITLADTDPLIWRRVEMPVQASLKMLHDVIQGAMGWYDCHLWEFELDDGRYGVPDPGWPDDRLFAAKNIKLKALLDRGVRRFLYTYDMGDNWEHLITVEAVTNGDPDTKYPRYVGGSRRAPPEDIGGVLASRPFWTPSPIPNIPNTRKRLSGITSAMENRLIRTSSTNSRQNSESATSPNAALRGKPLLPREDQVDSRSRDVAEA